MKKKALSILAACVAFGMLTACGNAAVPQSDANAPGAPADEVYELKLANIYPTDHPFNVGCQEIADAVSEKTNGKVQITIFPGAQLGEETAEINSLQAGAIDIAILGAGEVGKRVPDFNIFEAPFVFDDAEDGIAAAANPIFDSVYEKTHEHGFTTVQMLYYGTRQLTTGKAVDSPADTKGLKLRVPDVPIYQYMAEYIFQAAPTPMSLSEVYLSLQQGVIDGQENPIPTIYAQKFNEVCSYINMTNHMVNIFPVIMSDTTRNRMPADYVQIIDKCFVEGAKHINQMVIDNESSLLAEMEESGVTVHVPSDRAAFESAAQALVEKCEEEGMWTRGLYNEVKELN